MAASQAKTKFPNPSWALNEESLSSGSSGYNKQRGDFHSSTVALGDRRGYAGSRGSAELKVAARMGSYSTDFAYTLYKNGMDSFAKA